MKELRRQGAIYYGERMAEADTIAGHSYTVACLSWLLVRLLKRKHCDLSVEKVLKLALCHDMGEAMIGDVGTAVKAAGVSTPEADAVKRLVDGLHDSDELIALHHDYECLASREAAIVKVADRLDAWAHALSTPSVHKLISAWRFYNHQVHQKLKKARGESTPDSFWGDLDELYRQACTKLEDSQVILLNEAERAFNEPGW